jgi:hypothetical protein
MTKYKRQKSKTANSYQSINNYKSLPFVDNISKPYYTVFVGRFGHKKPNREDVHNFFQNLGPIG